MSLQVKIRALLLILAAAAFVDAQNDGRYRPPVAATLAGARPRPTVRGGGGGGDGRYQPSNDGRYRGGGDGRYRGGNDGRYVHQDVPYVHDDRSGGQYEGDEDRFGPGGGGGGGAGASGGAGRSGSNNGALGAGNGALGAGSSALGAGNGAAIGAGAALQTTTPRKPAPKPAAVDIAATLPKGKGTGEGGNGWRILQLFDKEEQDGYHYIYETENGILAEENGRIEKLAPEADGLRSSGFYEYTGDDGVLYRVDYVADDNGFVPQGAHLPTPPPYVAKLLAYLAANAKK
ncbi:larval cuticle protein LCP-30 [Ceratitis capitata]|uniref:larval cuticle protein LCP-30 n=1 Tax=Ceratitis capitata TaxID=7213 RepID=UPI000329E24C|nr:larval cuticle protein LCP-30 [Ceratitis capitata]